MLRRARSASHSAAIGLVWLSGGACAHGLALECCCRRERKKWDFHKAATSFYDDPANARVTAVIAHPGTATLLRKPEASGTSGQRGSRTAVLQDSEAMHCVRVAEEAQLTSALKHVFEEYNRWEGGVNSSRMDKIRFHKVLRCAADSASGSDCPAG